MSFRQSDDKSDEESLHSYINNRFLSFLGITKK